MDTKRKIFDCFYLRAFLSAWGICGLVWSFMIFQFWWGNHDWGYLKSGVSLSSGFFEARYSQHLPTVLFLDGHILPVLTIMSALAMLVILGILVGVYLEIPKSLKNYLFMALFVGLNPYNFVLFYYGHYMFPLAFWGCMDVILLFFCEEIKDWWKVIAGGLLFCFILGSYLPNVALILVLFIAKRVIRYAYGVENLKQIARAGLSLCVVFLLGYVGYFTVCICLKAHSWLNAEMYNLELKSFREILVQFLPEAAKGVLQFFHKYSFLEQPYSILLSLLFGSAVIYAFFVSKGKKRGVVLLLLFAMIVVSRLFFLLSKSDVAAFRMEYWGKLGLCLFALGILLRAKQRYIQNYLLLLIGAILVLFVNSNFEIQKVQSLGFNAARKYQARLVDDIVTHPQFEMKAKYLSFTFGYPKFRERYMLENKYNTGEMVGLDNVFPFDAINQLFWEDKQSPIVVGGGFFDNGGIIFSERNKRDENITADYWLNNAQNMQNIRYWLYTQAKYRKVYIDDKYIVQILSLPYFYKYRETAISSLSEQKVLSR